MNRTLTAVLAATMLILSACSSNSDGKEAKADKETNTNASQPVKPTTITGKDYDEAGGADAYAFAGDNAESRYYKAPDFYHAKSDDQLLIIENFETFQQTTEWSCGPATSLMVANHFGVTDLTEMGIAEQMKAMTDLDTPGAKPGSANNFPEYGSDVSQLYDFFSNLEGFKVVDTSYRENVAAADLIKSTDGATENNVGNLPATFTWNSLYASENSDTTEAWVSDAKDSFFVKWLTDHLSNNRPVMVEWSDWDGHWQAIIGYDNNGTPAIGDDMLIFADPYDTSDQWQDGYFFFPLERWFGQWNDRNIAPKPFQLQPYIVVDYTK
ncbi:papain-like cysteine protease family protein [Bacillus sp. FJAT-22090]|uniref:papain-like cysteine protease family protein n=1 Tax=Bacillus sp. FJAT-22090 TaxID=1581038 RepID=UPI00119CB698|nr:papain-like cysteine protease family protein [Bacillus sp. FJAT-22090]